MKLSESEYTGLQTDEVTLLQQKHGLNVLPAPNRHLVKKWLLRFFAPIPLMLIAAAGFSFLLDKAFDGWFIIGLFFFNLLLSVWHEWKSDSTLKLLNQSVTLLVKTLRDGEWTRIDSSQLVRGDIIELNAGSVIPADAKVVRVNGLTVNESALTGESLPLEKKVTDSIFAGSFIATGLVRAEVTATAATTRFGKVIGNTDIKRKPSLLEHDILTISRFLSLTSIGVAGVISVVWWFTEVPILEIIRFDLTLLIAGIPVALPVVMSLIIGVGTINLSKKGAVIRRLSALEDLANVDVLLSDKTGTLTKNEIAVQALINYSSLSDGEVAKLAAMTAVEADYHTLEKAIVTFANTVKTETKYALLSNITADGVRKRSTVLVKVADKFIKIALGAPQIILGLSSLNEDQKQQFEKDVDKAAERGLRVLALAVKRGLVENEVPEADMELLGIFLLSDELRDDAKEVVAFMQANGVEVKMVTGDSLAISREVGQSLGLSGAVMTCRNQRHGVDEVDFVKTSVFSEVYPEDKQQLVTLAQKTHIVGVTGDGINDLPAVRAANVGIAVSNAVDALKSTADIVLVQDGIGVISEAVLESRKIFARIYSYSVYRISESIRLILAVAIFGIILAQPILTPLQLIILALLNDLPIISLAFNRVEISHKPSHINVKKRFIRSLLFGLVGVFNSVLFYVLAKYQLHLSLDQIQTLFFLKLTIGGHLLIYVSHTSKRWYRQLPALPVILATGGTQLIATMLAFFGWFMTGVSIWLILLVWVWALFWMQISELTKVFKK